MSEAVKDFCEELAADMVGELRLALRVSGDVYDAEISTLAASAFEDMVRVGIDLDYISERGARVRNACACYVKAHFGYDNPEADRFAASYRQIVTDMLNSEANTASSEEDQ